MMSAGDLYRQIADRDNIRLAFLKAARGKQARRDVIDFRKNFEENIEKIHGQLEDRNPDIGHYRYFQVYDPKKRLICAASFPERVLHHAIMNICEPVLESYAIYDSYACRKGKGGQKAILRAQEFAGRFDWFLKLDVRKYFDSIDHAILLGALARRFREKDILLLFEKIMSSYEVETGKGLPIGNLISQHLANFYLSVFDHWIKEERKVRGYVRYMDDFLIFDDDRDKLMHVELPAIKDFLQARLSLTVKPDIQMNRCARGIPFLGYRVFPQKILLSPRSKRRFVNKFRLYEGKQMNGEWSVDELVRHMDSLLEFTRFADSDGFRRNVISRFGVLS
ncbi:MAG TPA: reverse transcriptase/maturase family protein [Syntrophales bacterium]|nr:reverse transcriptase/maturase family protein [Syntrophales bacterium]HOM08416.1 reverse transcriptase/maturase family protein [Syntrophales bacterium]HON98859.1 reverse transcriptase/maturase family protein [Syntrophales bacterium]HPQ06527.1 reverse transcriptase/maturase family protein [Syntrophales bacterium]